MGLSLLGVHAPLVAASVTLVQTLIHGNQHRGQPGTVSQASLGDWLKDEGLLCAQTLLQAP